MSGPWVSNNLSNAQAAAVAAVTPDVLSGSAGAASNTALIQARLSAGGTIFIAGSGVAYVNSTLFYESNSDITIASGLTIRMVAGIRLPVFRTRSYQTMLTAPVTVTATWSSGMAFNVQWTGHGLVAGDAIWLDGTTLQPVFKGVFVVQAVVDANNVTLRADLLPTATPTGTVLAVRATQHLRINGGTVDYNYDLTFATTPTDRQCNQFVGVYDMVLRNQRTNNAAKFAYLFCATRDVKWYDIGSDGTNSDMVKIYGPAVNVKGCGLTGNCGDDGVSFQPKEGAAFLVNMPTWGNVLHCTVRDIRVKSVTSVACFYLEGTTGVATDGYMDACGFENVHGAASNGVRFAAGGAQYEAGKLWVKNVEGEWTYPAKLEQFAAEDVTLEDISQSFSATSPADMILVSSTWTVRRTTIIRPQIASQTWVTGSGQAINWAGGGNILIIKDAHCKTSAASNARMLAISTTSTTPTFVIDGGDSDADQVVDNLSAVTPTISLVGFRSTGAAIVSPRANCVVTFSQCDFSNATNGVIRGNATCTVTLKGDGTNVLRAGSWVVQAAGTLTCNPQGMDLGLDIGGTGITKTAGNYCFNTGTARGTVAQNRHVTCNGTNWVQVDTPANVF